jgi:hypothetical protein
MMIDEAGLEANLGAHADSEGEAGRALGTAAFLLLFRRVRLLLDRVDALEAGQGRATVVDTLPANAPLGMLIRLRGDLTGALYLGNGPARPLTKLVPVDLDV